MWWKCLKLALFQKLNWYLVDLSKKKIQVDLTKIKKISRRFQRCRHRVLKPLYRIAKPPSPKMAAAPLLSTKFFVCFRQMLKRCDVRCFSIEFSNVSDRIVRLQFTLFNDWFVHQTKFGLVPNQSENCNYNPNWVWIKDFSLCNLFQKKTSWKAVVLVSVECYLAYLCLYIALIELISRTNNLLFSFKNANISIII